MAIRWGKIGKNPVKGMKMFKERSIERFLTEEEIVTLIEVSEKSKNTALKSIILTALNTGGRLREILNLRVRDLDFRNSIITLEHTKNGNRGKIPMNDYLKVILEEHLKGNNYEYVFCKKDGKPLKDIRAAFKSALKMARIENFRFHDLRHTFASHLALKGVDLYTLQKLLRHKTLAMVMKYAHLSPKHQQTAINALTGLFNKPKLSTNLERDTFAKVVEAV